MSDRGQQFMALADDVKALKLEVKMFRSSHDKWITTLKNEIAEVRSAKRGIIIVVAFVSSTITLVGSQFPKLLTFVIGAAK